MTKLESIRARAAQDAAFADALKAAKTQDELLEKFHEAGIDVTADDFSTMKQESGVEISDEELSKVVGGFLFFFF